MILVNTQILLHFKETAGKKLSFSTLGVSNKAEMQNIARIFPDYLPLKQIFCLSGFRSMKYSAFDTQ